MAEKNATLSINGTDLPLGNIPGFTFDKNDPKFVKIDDLVNKEWPNFLPKPIRTHKGSHLRAFHSNVALKGFKQTETIGNKSNKISSR